MKCKTVVFNGQTFYKSTGPYFHRGSMQLQRAVWQHHFGPIPKGCDIHHVDKNPENNNIANLVCIPEREHARQHAKEYFAGKTTAERRALMPQLEKELRNNTCAECGKVFTGFGKRWCSNACYLRARYRSGVCNVTKKCVVCGKPFIVNKYSTQTSCGRKCGSVLSHGK